MIVTITCILPTTPVESIRLATLTALPQMSYWGFLAPVRRNFCLYVCLFVCLLVCLLFVCLFVCLIVCLFVCLFNCFFLSFFSSFFFFSLFFFDLLANFFVCLFYICLYVCLFCITLISFIREPLSIVGAVWDISYLFIVHRIASIFR